MRMRIFQVLVLLLWLLHAYIGWRLLPALGAGPIVSWVIGGLLVASCVLIPFGSIARFIKIRPHQQRWVWAGLVLMGWFSSLFVLTLLRDLLLAVSALFDTGQDTATTLRSVSAWAVLGGATALSIIGFFNARRRAAVVAIPLKIETLHNSLQGLRIVQISDVHIGPTIQRDYINAIVQAINELDADIVAITGDLVDGSVNTLAHHAEPLAQINARHGTFFVTGNHEYYSGAHAWIEHLPRLGIRVLLNEHVVINHNDTPLVLAGVADYTAHQFDESHRSDPHRALTGAPGDALKILLAHQPRSAAAAAEAGFDLQLSGHTHGGQFLPWNFFVPMQQPFTAGLSRWGRLQVYTSRGTGYWGPPKRVGAPSEITLLTLVQG